VKQHSIATQHHTPTSVNPTQPRDLLAIERNYGSKQAFRRIAGVDLGFLRDLADLTRYVYDPRYSRMGAFALVMLNHFTTSAVLPVKRRITGKMISILR